jgi:hypothetical protein
MAARIFAVGWEKQCALVLCILGAALAIPLRSGFLAMSVLTALVVAATVHERRFLPRGHTRYTIDTLFVRLVLLALPCIASVRALHYLGPKAWLVAMLMMAGGALAAWLWDLILRKDDGIAPFISDLAIACATLPAGVALLESQYAYPLWSFCPTFGVCTVYAGLFPGMYLLISARMATQRVSWRMVLGHYALLSACALLSPGPSLVMQLAFVGIPAAIALQSYRTRSLVTMLASIAVVLYRTDELLLEILRTIADYRWSALMVTGIALIFGASYVEKGARRVVQHWRRRPATE